MTFRSATGIGAPVQPPSLRANGIMPLGAQGAGRHPDRRSEPRTAGNPRNRGRLGLRRQERPALLVTPKAPEIHVPTGGRQTAASIALGPSTEKQAGISGVKSETSDIIQIDLCTAFNGFRA